MARTILPPSEGNRATTTGQLDSGTDVQNQTLRPARLITPDGRQQLLQPEVYSLIEEMLAALIDGRAVTLTVHGTDLTTQQAADLLGVSRPTMVRLLDDGTIPSTRPNKHRRVRLADVEEYRARRRRTRSAGLAALVQLSEDLDLYDEDPEPIHR